MSECGNICELETWDVEKKNKFVEEVQQRQKKEGERAIKWTNVAYVYIEE